MPVFGDQLGCLSWGHVVIYKGGLKHFETKSHMFQLTGLWVASSIDGEATTSTTLDRRL